MAFQSIDSLFLLARPGLDIRLKQWLDNLVLPVKKPSMSISGARQPFALGGAFESLPTGNQNHTKFILSLTP